jgi:hypothetical protein
MILLICTGWKPLDLVDLEVSIISRLFSAAHNLQSALIEVRKCFYLLSVRCSESSKIKNAEMRDAGRVGSKLCTLDHDWLRNSRVSDLSHYPTCQPNGSPAEC